jgi:hypothetical protein
VGHAAATPHGRAAGHQYPQHVIAALAQKMVLETVTTVRHQGHVAGEAPASEILKFRAVARKDSYPSDGSDENNTYAKFSPSATIEITVANPALIGRLNPGEFYYVDFTPVE